VFSKSPENSDTLQNIGSHESFFSKNRAKCFDFLYYRFKYFVGEEISCVNRNLLPEKLCQVFFEKGTDFQNVKVTNFLKIKFKKEENCDLFRRLVAVFKNQASKKFFDFFIDSNIEILQDGEVSSSEEDDDEEDEDDDEEEGDTDSVQDDDDSGSGSSEEENNEASSTGTPQMEVVESEEDDESIAEVTFVPPVPKRFRFLDAKKKDDDSESGDD
jgi:hypothetical protein